MSKIAESVETRTKKKKISKKVSTIFRFCYDNFLRFFLRVKLKINLFKFFQVRHFVEWDKKTSEISTCLWFRTNWSAKLRENQFDIPTYNIYGRIIPTYNLHY